ncbi:MAG: hypothetical protein HY423_03680, partial [Candidatus Lambdaproteobacteria bacterium]|nr:hypothetical protein [Candidatus Lambdaproteobacteria bacterium]
MLSLAIWKRGWHFREVSITVHWALLLAIGIFWVRGVHGFPAGSRFDNLAVQVLVVACFAYFAWNISNPEFRSRFDLVVSPLAGGLAALAAIALSWPHLAQSLWSDQVYHASSALRLS